ncbi:MAG: hypothetical protein HQL58_01025 [Magnetococcales bacterium]|nr:hypothetical protein [Magnetococcales bacterium]
MSNPVMKQGEWVVAIGLVLLIGFLLAALLPDLFSTPYVGTQPQSLVQAQTGPGTMMVDVAQQQPVAQMMNVAVRQPKPGLVLLQQAPKVNFKGVVQQLSEQPQSDGQLHVWLQDSKGIETQVSVGPGWFLHYLGCNLAHDVTMSGAGFTFEKAGSNPLVYAKRIEINGKVCQLRNDEGFALWSNKLR